jgi:23S rRNA-/tRNA-specific pseudouridylate synthase
LDLERRILHEKGGLLVLDKPHGLPTAGRTLRDPDCLQYQLMERHGGPVWAVHQLDADTTGLNVFATRKKLVPELQRRMRSPVGTKTYLAIVHGEPHWDEREVSLPIGWVDERSLGVVAGGKAASSAFLVLDRSGGFAMVQGRLFTGRTHQLRIHLASLGHPLVGEEWYRDPPCTVHPRQALHAWRLQLGPGTGPDQFFCALAPDLVERAEALGLAIPPS